jgi:hypothetical protein
LKIQHKDKDGIKYRKEKTAFAVFLNSKERVKGEEKKANEGIGKGNKAG